jgi:hypothetical protein
VRARESGVVVSNEDPAREHLEVYDTKTGLWHPQLGEVSQPSAWDFLPAGDAFLTRRVKAAGEYWQLFQPKGRRAHRRLLGLLAPSDAIAAARLAAEASHAERETRRVAGARQRAKSEAAYQAEFEQAVVEWLDFAPQHDELAREIAVHAAHRAVQVGSGRVGRTKTMTLGERAALAARACIRHRYTDYEHHLEDLGVAEFGFDDHVDIADLGHYREIKRDAHRAVDEFLERHRTPT